MLYTYKNNIFNPKCISNKIIPLLIRTLHTFTTFNQLIEAFEIRPINGTLFICYYDTEVIITQHLILFCIHFNIKYYILMKGAKAIIENGMKRKNVALVFVKSEDVLYEKIVDAVELENNEILNGDVV